METQIFPHAKIQSSKNPLEKSKIFQDIVTVQLISSFNTTQNIIFQKSLYKNSFFYRIFSIFPPSPQKYIDFLPIT
jgi:hypothetical protein